MAAPRPIPSSEHCLASNRGTTVQVDYLCCMDSSFPWGSTPRSVGTKALSSSGFVKLTAFKRICFLRIESNRTIETLAAQQQIATDLGVLGNQWLDKSSQQMSHQTCIELIDAGETLPFGKAENYAVVCDILYLDIFIMNTHVYYAVYNIYLYVYTCM